MKVGPNLHEIKFKFVKNVCVQNRPIKQPVENMGRYFNSCEEVILSRKQNPKVTENRVYTFVYIKMQHFDTAHKNVRLKKGQTARNICSSDNKGLTSV